MKRFAPYLFIMAGGLIYSVGLNAFIVGNGLAEGGFVGISVLLLYKFHVPIGASFFLMNLPLLYWGWKLFGHEFILKTFVGVLSLSVFTAVTAGLSQPVHDRLLAALYGGVLSGAGLGIIFRSGGTTGGADIVARVVRHFLGYSMGRILFSSDVVVILLVAVVVGKEVAMYSLVALFVASRVIDFVIEGRSLSRAAVIISDRSAEIARRIHDDMGRGTTFLHGQGGFTGQDRKVVYCVVNRDEIIRLQKLVEAVDDRAFVVLNDVHEVLGEGFTR